MSGIAFYAPLKSPNHPIPSGEREMARNLIRALSSRGYDVELSSEFRSLEKKGHLDAQTLLMAQAETEISALKTRRDWSAWVTYHSYYKAPDLLGPALSKALNIPYFVIEATRASKRLGGPWDGFEKAAVRVCETADVLFHVTQRDAVALRPHIRSDQSLMHLAPFLDIECLPAISQGPRDPVILIVGMMREGDKLASYEIAADVLHTLEYGQWRVEIAGDGPARAKVENLMAPFGERISFLGALDKQTLQLAYRRARALLWPGMNEAFGMVYLEAQAQGVPVVAENRSGVSDVVASDGLFAIGEHAVLAQDLKRLLNDNEYHARRTQVAREKIQAHHLLGAARDTLWGAMARYLPEVA
ncbi:glycosyltransferase family 4 protein [Shimia abyssi]|uniref:Glycosyltransferase involved in cell wall biosynthesis n=1 Tax=Shimia abyssi TaxID=1662395 RepID=A0A2P8FAK1_9RHOB|nr:glycosyltransferase family 4 protein [Shimia abyssi]PSL18753.1 glycosyltransferase involved in cell wall biosynthesis [Shimia abyssi]